MTTVPGSVSKPSMGIAVRIALWSWIVTLATLLTFVAAIIPQQQRTFQENLESKAHGVAVSLRDITVGAVVNEDFSSVVDHCRGMLSGDPTIEYLVITKSDGFSLINERSGWRAETNAGPEWIPAKRLATSGIGFVPLFNRRVFQYSQPFDYSGIEWGWIHVGLSLKSYDRNVAAVYHRTGVLAVGCILLGLAASAIYAQRLVRPILTLRNVVRRIAGGDLSVRAPVARRDELGNLAGSINVMTEALLRRDEILQSVRYAGQQLLSVNDWHQVVQVALNKIGLAARASRAYIFENHPGPNGALVASQRYEYAAADQEPLVHTSKLQNLPWYGTGFELWAEHLRRGEILEGHVQELNERQRAALAPQQIQSLILVPITVGSDWWGYVGLDECSRERTWTDAERDSMRAIADMLGAAIARQRTQNALVEAKQNLEQRVQERTRALEEEMAANRRNEADKETILSTAQIGIIIVERQTHAIRYLNATAQKLIGRTQQSLLGERCHTVMCPAEMGKCPITDLHQQVDQSERELLDQSGNRIPILKSVAPITYRGESCLIESFVDLTERKQAEQVVEGLHKELVQASRRAGMAEVATGVLHNVGNVLNSVNVSVNLVNDQVRRSKIPTLARVSSLLEAHRADLGAFLTTDPKGRRIPDFLGHLAGALGDERERLVHEMSALLRNVGHIKEIVAMQQDYARVAGVIEDLSITDLLEDAIRMNEGAFHRRGVTVKREFEDVPPVRVDKHKVLQILVNLVSNARHAMEATTAPDKVLTMSVRRKDPQRVMVTVRDNGVGIAPENLTRIFAHGFTTKKDGHGFGLHSGALAAKEMGGSLQAYSDGPGTGATFVLELPIASVNSTPQSP